MRYAKQLATVAAISLLAPTARADGVCDRVRSAEKAVAAVTAAGAGLVVACRVAGE